MSDPGAATAPVLAVSGLTIDFPKAHGRIGLVDDVSFSVGAGECLSVVGESGSGKTLLGLAIMGLLPPGAAVTGSIRLLGDELVGMPEAALRRRRGTDLAMIYQDALTSLNPGMTIGRQLGQAVREESSRTPAELLDAVQIRDVRRCLSSYPHELSGGQRQRVLIALAIARRPKVIVADEPTTALDVTVQAAVMALLAQLRAEFGFALLFVSHDLGLVSTVADRVAVMYAGQLAEVGSVHDVLRAPRHPYASGLLAASRSLEEGGERLAQIPGVVPPPAQFRPACRFADRCPRATADCDATRPPLVPDGGRLVACHHPITASEDALTWTDA